MSRRKIRRRRNEDKKKHTYMSNFFMIKAKDTGELRFADAVWKVENKAIPFMPLYERAHKLMPPPKTVYVNPEEYRDEQAPSIELLQQATDGEMPSEDALLRALAILGHSPNQTALMTLARFKESHHTLAPVASLALSECTSLYDVFMPHSMASLPC